MVYRDHNILAAVSLGFFVLAIIPYLSDRKFSRSYLFYTFLLSLLVGIATMFIFFSHVCPLKIVDGLYKFNN